MLSGANVVHFVDAKNRKQLKISSLRIICRDPVGIQTQDLQNRNLTLYSAKLRGHLPAKISKSNAIKLALIAEMQLIFCKDTIKLAQYKRKMGFSFVLSSASAFEYL